MLKVTLESPEEVRKLLRGKRALKDSDYSSCFLRPSLPSAERERRTLLREIASNRARTEGHDKGESPYRVLLNDRNDNFELRVLDPGTGKLDWSLDALLPTDREWEAARQSVRGKQAQGNGLAPSPKTEANDSGSSPKKPQASRVSVR